MELVYLKPTSPGQRFTVRLSGKKLFTKEKPVKRLTSAKKRINGRNNHGRITVRRRGGGAKRRYRIVDFLRNDKDGIVAKVEQLAYDPNRSAYLALLLYADGERRYIIAPKGLQVGDMVSSGPEAAIVRGNCLPLENIPVGSVVHNIELKRGKGAQLARSAGAFARVMAKEGMYVTVRLRSGEVRKVHCACRATLGEVGNGQHALRRLGKAGATRWRGRRPKVRGVAMNPVDHPHGGGEGRTAGGRHPVSPTAVLDGKRTRNNKRTQRMIVGSRHQK